MNATLTTTLALCLLTLSANAQHFCGFDALRALHPEQEAACNGRILTRLLDGDTRTGEVLTVPVVVHIVHQDGPENLPDEVVVDAIGYLNDALSNNGAYQNALGVNTDIQFCLAAVDPEGEFTTGIERVASELTDVLVPAEEESLKALSHWDGELYLNIWVVGAITREENNEGVVGFATFPSSHGDPIDGIVVEAATMGASAMSTAVLVHEVGHYLGLYHTFQNGCPNDDCLTSGDWVCDTPPDASAFNLICFDGTNSCATDEDDTGINNPFRPVALGGLGDQEDMQTNFMDYASLACFERFTEGQSDRMRASLLEIRSSLLEGDRCEGPCSSPIDVLVNSTELEIEMGESVDFANLSSNTTSAEWFLDGASQGTGVGYTFTPAVQGTYTVSIDLEGEEPGCAETVFFEVTVTCPVTSAFDVGPTSIEPGGTIDLVNASAGATALSWHVDGVPVSAEENPTLGFDAPGVYTIQLLAEGPTCAEWSTPVNVTVGTCTSGNEGNVWLFFNPSGTGYGLDFNANPPTVIEENNLPADVSHCKTTFCDAAGNVLFVSTGTEVLNRDFEVMPNGDDLWGNTSSHYGTMIVARPNRPDEFYLFHSDGWTSDGLNYSIIDRTLDDGYGDVTVKNQNLGDFEQEAFTCIRHCNMVDFWLITYDQVEGRYLSWLVTEEGVSDAPVESAIEQEVQFSYPLTPTAKGDRIMHGDYLMDVDAATGALSVIADFGGNEIIGWEFSANGRYLYLSYGLFTTDVAQVDLWELDVDDPMAGAVNLPVATGAVYIWPQRAPDGNIYMENAFGGEVARIVGPNLPANQLVFEEEYDNFSALINSFGNYFHRYVGGESLFVEGEGRVCAGQDVEYTVYGAACLLENVTWTVEGAGFTVLSNGQIVVHYPSGSIGDVFISATLDAACGTISGSLEVEVQPDAGLDLGEDFGTCDTAETFVLDAGPGFGAYVWSTGETGQSIAVSAPGVYGVTVDTGLCTASDEVEVTAVTVSPIDLGPDTLLCDGGILLLDAGEGYNDYVWQDGTTGPAYTVFEGGTYIVSATVPCAASDTLYVDGCGGSIGLSVGEPAQGDASVLRIVPNPNRGAFTLHWDGRFPADQWILISTTGQTVAEGRIESGRQAQIRTDVAAGAYVLRLQGASGAQHARLIIE